MLAIHAQGNWTLLLCTPAFLLFSCWFAPHFWCCHHSIHVQLMCRCLDEDILQHSQCHCHCLVWHLHYTCTCCIKSSMAPSSYLSSSCTEAGSQYGCWPSESCLKDLRTYFESEFYKFHPPSLLGECPMRATTLPSYSIPNCMPAGISFGLPSVMADLFWCCFLCKNQDAVDSS